MHAIDAEDILEAKRRNKVGFCFWFPELLTYRR